MTQDYSSKDIKVLDEISHVRLNPSMYISRTNEPGHLIEEPFDNSLDEALAGHAKNIKIILDTKKHIYSISDDGRGIPIENDTPIIVSTKLFSGAKFQDRKEAYQICSGLHGVGLVTVLALSKSYSVEIYRTGKHAIFSFIDGKLKEKKIDSFTGVKPFSTKITFSPDKKYFESLEPDINRIRQRIFSASVELADCSFELTVDGNKEVIKLDRESHFKTNCLNDGDNELSDVIDIISQSKAEMFEVKFCFSFEGTVTPRFISSVNLLPVQDGGTHVNLFYDIIKDYFGPKAKEFNVKYLPQDCLVGLRAYFNLRLIEPKFSGQAKYKLNNSKSDLERFSKDLISKLDSYFKKNPNSLKFIIEHFVLYRAGQDSKKIKTNNGKRGSTKFTKLRECTSPQGELFIVEGDSAAGGFVQSRDPRRHAIFPLKGKIGNVVTKKEILDNKEIKELIEALGTGIGTEFDINKLKYDKIICAADADVDGAHISCLLIMLFGILTPEIVKQGKLFLALTPLYAINEKKLFLPLWTKDDLDKAVKENRTIGRFKGLGEMQPEQLRISTMDEKTRKLIPIDFTTDMDYLVKLLSDTSEKRKLVDS